MGRLGKSTALGAASALVAGGLDVGESRAGAWTRPAGEIWFKAVGIYQLSDEFYAESAAVLPDGTRVGPGDARPYDDDGVSRQRVLWLETEVGLTTRLTLGAQIGWKDLTYEDRIQKTNSHGWGDLWLTSRVALLTGHDRLTARTALKLPTGRFSREPGRIPIGENQADLDLGLQWGRSLGRPLSWVGIEGAHRLRFRDRDSDFDPADEWTWNLEAGWGLDGDGRVGLKGSWRGARGDEESVNFLAPGLNLERDVDQLELVLLVDAGPVFLELGRTHTLASESYPSAAIWVLGVSRTFARAE